MKNLPFQLEQFHLYWWRWWWWRGLCRCWSGSTALVRGCDQDPGGGGGGGEHAGTRTLRYGEVREQFGHEVSNRGDQTLVYKGLDVAQQQHVTIG